MSSGQLEGTVSVVTGSGRRTGRVLAQRLAACGASVVLAARSEDELTAVADKIRTAGGTALPVATDVTSEEDCDELMRRAVAEFGRIDHLVNTAGVYLTGPFENFDTADWQKTLDVYLTGPFLCCRSAVGPMRQSGGGHIINFSSRLVEMALPGFEAYCAAKAGLEGFSRSLASSLRPLDIKVTVLVPTAINAMEKEPATDKMLEMEDIADTVQYLLTLPKHVHIPSISLNTLE